MLKEYTSTFKNTLENSVPPITSLHFLPTASISRLVPDWRALPRKRSTSNGSLRVLASPPRYD